MFVERSQVEAALPGYELGRELGSGASGVVLEAQHRQINRRVAVKVLTRAGEKARAGFRREADVLAGLDHPHIVRIYDYVERGDLSMLIMEHLSGGTLRSRLSRTTPAAACAVGLAAADALAAAHTAGVLHRDVKLANILFARDDAPKLVDFGISRYFGGSATSVESIAGTPGYMAPEQIGGGRVGPGTDLYALGVVLYRLLSGRMPIDPALPVAHVWKRQLDGPLPAPVGVAEPLTAVIVQALQQARADRQQSARVFARQLAEAAATVFGPGWLATSGIIVRAERDILDAAEPPPGAPPLPGVPPPPAAQPRLPVAGTSGPARTPSQPPSPPPASSSHGSAPPPPSPSPSGRPLPAAATPATAAKADLSPPPQPVPGRPTRPPPPALDPPTRPTLPAADWLARPSTSRSPSPSTERPPPASPDRPSRPSTGRFARPSPDPADPPSAPRRPSGSSPWARQTPAAANPAGGARVPPPVRPAVLDGGDGDGDGDGDGSLMISTVADVPSQRRPGGRRSLLVAASAGLAALVIALVLVVRPGGSTGGGPSKPGDPGAANGQATVTVAAQIGSAVGPDRRLVDATTTGAEATKAIITALAVGDDGVQVAVGRRTSSLALTGPTGTKPVVWLREDGPGWHAFALPLPAGTQSGTVSAVAFLAGRGFVAVGAAVVERSASPSSVPTTAPPATAPPAAAPPAAPPPATDGGATADLSSRPALWRSADGRNWGVLPTSGGLTGEVTGLVTHDGGLLAVGRPAGALGDGAVWRSAEGTSWTRLGTPSLGGPAEQHVDQVVELADGSLLAAGSELSGSATVTRLRHSSDATSWRLIQTTLPPGVLVHAFALLSDGRVLAAGSIAGDGPASEQPAVLVGSRTGEGWTVHPVTMAMPTRLLGAAVVDGAVLLTGADATMDTGTPTAGIWSLPPL
ncbi:serine/threonine protein kinase [Frankia sp. AiPs1]|uniref:serine/threonine-protein kinase n=1 Tax=Frankia sp. AiPs1 TaxID=573493 RepID=UPI00204472F6|nr:serine/threonine-protein kinase [Frankia sp. AiPs1]MCM3922650.1 serine/threonine protein kinase [Frankia sp. AiPs1]